MIALSKAVTDEEIQIAATYFATLKPRANIGVVETGNVGQISVANWMLAENKSGAKEAIDQRIIELPGARSTLSAAIRTRSLSPSRSLGD